MNWLKRFMMGRYGSDQLSFAILIVGMIFVIIGSFFRTSIPSFFVLLLIVISIYRMFSKNITARSRENAAFLKIWNKIKNRFYKEKMKFQDKKNYRFFTCPSCKKTLRVPKGKGRIYVTCPKCGERFIKKT